MYTVELDNGQTKQVTSIQQAYNYTENYLTDWWIIPCDLESKFIYENFGYISESYENTWRKRFSKGITYAVSYMDTESRAKYFQLAIK